MNQRPNPRIPLATRFWQYVDKTPGCWLWIGATRVNGYGQIGSGGAEARSVSAHRVSWELHHGPIPEGLWVLHQCDVRNCVRPDHLFLGTPAENVRDMDAKGRRRSRPRAGSLHAMAKLGEAQVLLIRQEYGAGGVTLEALAQRFAVGETTIGQIVRRQTWRHLP